MIDPLEEDLVFTRGRVVMLMEKLEISHSFAIVFCVNGRLNDQVDGNLSPVPEGDVDFTPVGRIIVHAEKLDDLFGRLWQFQIRSAHGILQNKCNVRARTE
jgi:hypothetical protein